MGRNLSLFLILAVTAWAAPARAAEPSYNLVELLAAETVVDSGGTARGYALNGSYDFGSGFFAEGLYYHLNDDSVPGGVTSENWFLGPGYRVHTEIVDVFLSVDYLHRSVSGGGTSSSQDGYRWVWGLRSAVTDRLELNTGVEKSSVGLTDTGLRLGESYRFTDKLALRAQYVWFSDAHSWVIGLRYNY
jgi:hypothetical protein